MKVYMIVLPSPVLGEPWANYPLGVAYVATVAREADHDVLILDYSDQDISKVKIPHADVYGLSVTTPQVPYAEQISKRIKEEYPDSLVVAGGPHALVSYDLTGIPEIDCLVVGEGEYSFLDLLDDYKKGAGLDTIYYKRPLDDLDRYPFPRRDLMPDFKEKAERIHQVMKGDYVEGGVTTIIASRGCPYACSFCAPHPRKVRFRSPLNAVEEIQQIKDLYNIHQFKWQDDTFSIKKPWVMVLCDLLKDVPDTYHRAHTRVNTFDREMAVAMKRAGFEIVCFGIESFSQRLLDLNEKRITVEGVERALRIAKEVGMSTIGFFMFGMPGEDPESVKETKEGILRNQKYIDHLNMATMVPLVGTPVWRHPYKYNCEIISRDYRKFWIVGHEDSDEILVRTKGVPLEVMKEMKRDIYGFLREVGYDRPEWKQKKEDAIASDVRV